MLARALGFAIGTAALAVVPRVAAAPGDASPSTSMARVPAGEFELPFRDAPEDSASGGLRVRVPAFRLDKRAVTVGEYRVFVRARPRYARSRIARLYADAGYLRAWENDTTPPSGTPEDAPVTGVSWYAAKAYCAEAGKRLPTTAEWERAAAAREPGTDAATHERVILAWYARRETGRPPAPGGGTRHAYGVTGLHGVIWEWTSDFNVWSGSGVNARGVTTGDDEAALTCGGAPARMAPGTPYSTYMRWAFRGSLGPDYTVATLGFRCARDE